MVSPAALATRQTSAGIEGRTIVKFRVRALAPGHRIEVVDVEAGDASSVRDLMVSRGWSVLSVRSNGAAGRFLRMPSTPRFDTLLFAQELFALVGAGLGVVEALDALWERAGSQPQRFVLMRLLHALRQGESLSRALSQQSAVFSPLLVGLVQAAEETSDLPRALERFVAHENRRLALQHRLVSAAIYPAMLLGAGLAVGLFLLVYVVPRFAMAYPDSGQGMPWASQVLLAWGRWASGYGLELALILGALTFGLVGSWRRALRTGHGHRLLRLVPRLPQAMHVLMLTRLYLALSMLLEGGIPILRAMQLSEAAVTRDSLGALRQARTSVSLGESLSSALAKADLTTPVSLRLLQAGERAGQLGLMLGRCADFHDAEISRWIERVGRSVEPVLMAAIGLVVGVIVVLLYLPIFELTLSF
jgi:general secretion pathway protein F